MSRMMKHGLGALLSLAVFAPGAAWADGTLVIRPTGTAKQRNIDKVSASFAKIAKGQSDLTMGDFEVGPDCITDAACMASAGKEAGASTVVGVQVSRTGPTFSLLFVAVHAESGKELARNEIIGLKRQTLGDMAAASLDEFIITLPSAPPEAAESVEPAAEEPVAPAPAVEAAPPMEPEILDEGDPEPAPEAAAEPVAVSEDVDVRSNVDDPGDDSSYVLELGLGTGVVLPQLASELSTAAGVEFDVGLPVWKSLSVVGAAAYSQPVVESNLDDPRLAGTMYETETTQRELTFTLGATWRFLERSSRINAYAGLGPRIWLLETRTNGSSGGMEFGENRETSTRYGAAGWAGAEFLVGPGAVAAELDVGGSDLPHLVTGDVATTAVALQVGYRLRI